MENLTEAWALAAQWARGGRALTELAVAAIVVVVVAMVLCLMAFDR